MTCQRADAFLKEHDASVGHKVNAPKPRIRPAQAVKLARSVRHLYVAKGKKVVHFQIQTDPPPDAELKKPLIGPSANLRAPTARAGDRLFVGFNPEEFAKGLWGD